MLCSGCVGYPAKTAMTRRGNRYAEIIDLKDVNKKFFFNMQTHVSFKMNAHKIRLWRVALYAAEHRLH